jgi:hypothetical protein
MKKVLKVFLLLLVNTFVYGQNKESMRQYVSNNNDVSQITFNVDLSFEISKGTFNSNFDKIYLTGSFTSPSWAEAGGEGSFLMNDADADGIYSITIHGIEFGEISYNYFKSNGVLNCEWNVTSPRTEVISDTYTTLNDFWGSYFTAFSIIDTKKPLENAIINIKSDNEVIWYTDQNGLAAGLLAPGNYNYTVSLVGYDDYSGDFSLSADLALDPISMTASGIDVLDKDGIIIYPNPTSKTVNYFSKNDLTADVFDISGKLVKGLPMQKSGTIDFSSPGIYFIRFNENQRSFTRKIVVQ